MTTDVARCDVHDPVTGDLAGLLDGGPDTVGDEGERCGVGELPVLGCCVGDDEDAVEWTDVAVVLPI